ncbi:MAG: ABC transporter ATP-binding protein [Treponema sp.]|nr:ABC transporter ATP-binding protein [Treponema sp.]
MALAIKIENLSKYYRLGIINNGTLWKDLQSHLARLFGWEDPNLVIGWDSAYDRDGFWALSGINMEIEQGDRIAVMGRNGAGKSTLLRILTRITAPTGGCFHVKGRIASLLEVGTGFHSELTGRENIFMNGAILGMKRREIKRKLDDIIGFSEISGRHIDTPVKRYSSGMHVRLGFAIAAYLDSEILLADEVLAVGDIKFRQKALDKMKDLSLNHGRTVIFVSHAHQMLQELCNKGIILENGKMSLDMSPVEEAVNRYNEMLGIELPKEM